MSMQLGYIEMKRAEMGDYGGTYINHTNAVSGSFWCVNVLQDAVFATGTVFNTATNPFGAATMPALASIPGEWTDIELVSGIVFAIKSR